jgi:hypothetical protein
MSKHPPNCHVYTECIVTRVLQLFYIFNYFTLSLLHGDTCLRLSRTSSDNAIWTFSSKSPSDADYGARHQPPLAWLLTAFAPVILSGCETRIGP